MDQTPNQTPDQVPAMPDQTPNQMPEMSNSTGKNKHTMYITIAVIAAAALAFFWWSQRPGVGEPALTPTPEIPAELEAINQDLENLNLNDLDTEFQEIDQELDTL